MTEPALRVGLGSAVITPPMPVVLAGFGARKGPVDEVHDDLTVQAVVLASGPVTVCLLVLDLLMLGTDVAAPLRAAVARELAVPQGAVLTSCTHTHSGPAATRSTRRIGWPMPEAYREVLSAGCVAAARQAARSAEPAVLHYARSPLPDGLSINRRGLPYSPQIALLDARRPDGTRVGSITNVGIHPVALGIECRAVSGDWVSSFRDAARASTGAPAVLLQGALGDVNPTRDPHTDPTPGGNWETAATLGQEVAAVTDVLTEQAQAHEYDSVVVHHRVMSARAGLTVPALLAGRALRRVDVELVEWELGPLRVVSMPGEAFHALGRAVESARGDEVLLAGIAPSWVGYLPEPFGRGYEEKMSYGRGFVAAVRDALLTPPGGAGA